MSGTTASFETGTSANNFKASMHSPPLLPILGPIFGTSPCLKSFKHMLPPSRRRTISSQPWLMATNLAHIKGPTSCLPSSSSSSFIFTPDTSSSTPFPPASCHHVRLHHRYPRHDLDDEACRLRPGGDFLQMKSQLRQTFCPRTCPSHPRTPSDGHVQRGKERGGKKGCCEIFVSGRNESIQDET